MNAIVSRRSFLRSLLLCCGWMAFSAGAADRSILVWGDSISAGLGLDADAGWVHLLEQRLQKQGGGYTVVNASVSGETTGGGLARLPAALDKLHPAIVLIELGGNDGLRAQSLPAMRANLEKMIDLSRAAGAQPVLFEMRIPSNYGPVYTDRFTQVFGAVAEARKAPMVPFFLAAIAVDPGHWFQDDGIHPNAAAQPQLLDAVWPTLAPLLGQQGPHVGDKNPHP
jgi:acyl-CoA thioesterase-1